ncbi:alanine--tRNA ligase [Sulfurovum sp. zt1-1]|uniref:Alanine--tRNA ligase n=1 Tax=Sulfurovum zhangzhouensis TaxID=3019067 RepID=A0ABT7QZH1_9BACT|nr:alanine--tRNA ligase [Sulfurovum zhangzhouensis]MDM5272230.1 alanine--tRNA ligase [Sulfurovum zhangzhouensis]
MDIRQKYLDYFESKGHRVVPSAPLIPIDDDGSLLFVNAGMVPFKGIFTGEEPIPNPPRATSAQTCIRAGGKHNDLDNVGYTARHHTMFEMLGNFSFGDYFKKEAMAYAWEFVTSPEYLALPIDRLWVTVHENDDEAFELWQDHVPADRIMRFGDKDNFWQMGDTGACGPCSEIFYDQGEQHFNGPEDYMGGEGDRFLEIWNLVFMQYERDIQGNLKPLPKPSIDTGMGFERVAAIKEGVFNNYHSSIFMPYLEKLGELVGTTYDYDAPNSASYRVIADHLRSTSFLLAQGVNFDKEGRGYVLRRIMRRAIRHGYLLGLREPFMYKLVDTIGKVMGAQYPYLIEKAEAIKASMKLEEERFFDTIDAGIKLFDEELENTTDMFNGEVAFKLYDTYGFPLDLTEDMLREKGIALDSEGFDRKMEAQKAQSKASWKGTGEAAATGDFKELKEKFGQNKFVGYEHKTYHTKVLGLLDENFKHVSTLQPGMIGWVMLEETPFYAESGGQTGDRGELEGKAKVLDTKLFQGMNLSEVEAKEVISADDSVVAIVDQDRNEIVKHHSATHLLHAALFDILGEHISQAGSLVEANRLRFDFSHPQALSAEEIRTIENWVNDKIAKGVSSTTQEMNIDDARTLGAKAQFGEKYGESVRVVSMGDISVELCGGTHVHNTSEIGLFVISKESGVSAGVRRIEAICGATATKYVFGLKDTLEAVKAEVKNQDPIAGIGKLKDQIKTLKDELQTALSTTKKQLSVTQFNGVNVVVDEVEAGDIKEMIDEAKNKYPNIAIMLFQKKGDKVLIACGSKETAIKAGDWIKEIAPVLGGGGGGRPDFAQAGGKDPSKIAEAKEKALAYLEENL